MQIQNPWVDKLYFGSPTSSQYIEVTGGDIQINSDLRISTASNDDALTRILAWDPSTNIIKYRNSNTISGGGGLTSGSPLYFTSGATAISFSSPTISVWGNLSPSQDYTYDLGNSSRRWRDLYVQDVIAASNSIQLGDLKLSYNGSNKLSLQDTTTTVETTIDSIIDPAFTANYYYGPLFGTYNIYYNIYPTLISPEGAAPAGQIRLQLYSTVSTVGDSLDIYMSPYDVSGGDKTDFFTRLQRSNNTVSKNILKWVGGEAGSIDAEFRADSVNYDFLNGCWAINATILSGTIDTVGGSVVAFYGIRASIYENIGATGSVVLTGSGAPTSSSSPGTYGEARMVAPYLYVYTNQWYRFTGATF